MDDEGDAARQERMALRARLVERVRRIPGVVAAGTAKYAPFTGDGEPRPFTVPGFPQPRDGEEPRVELQPVSPGYLEALGTPLLAGADVDAPRQDSTAAAVAVISRSMAERFWAGRDAVGRTFLVGETPIQVVGVAADVRTQRLDSAARWIAYVPEAIMQRSHVSLVVRTNGDPAMLAGPVRTAIHEVLPNQVIRESVPLVGKVGKVGEAASTPRFFTVLVSVFGVLALALAAVGLYGVVSYVVGQRQREIGVRVALGAPPAGVVALMLRRGMTPVLVGLGVGMVAALAATRLLDSLLLEVSATDPLTFVAVALLLGTVALLASYLPSRRAARVDPTVALRAE